MRITLTTRQLTMMDRQSASEMSTAFVRLPVIKTALRGQLFLVAKNRQLQV